MPPHHRSTKQSGFAVLPVVVGLVLLVGIMTAALYYARRQSSLLRGTEEKREATPARTEPSGVTPTELTQPSPVTDEPTPARQRVDFSHLHPSFRFSASLPPTWQAEFVPDITAINVYDPQAPGPTTLEQSQLFIRNFEASQFLTLATVAILDREETTVNGHAAVRYEIEKKAGVPDFPHQPSWRSARHRLVDVRFTDDSPSLFYVFAYNPTLPATAFEEFVNSLTFHNDAASWQPPLEPATERVTKKPFGIEVSPENSPVSPERFSGYHTGVDFETLPGEEETDVIVRTICGGEVRMKRQASGYGGVVVQECLFEDEVLMVVYGHLRLGSVTVLPGEYLAPGAALAMLGTGGSNETDGERKHLHLGLHRERIDLRGYVGSAAELGAWRDPPLFFGSRGRL